MTFFNYSITEAYPMNHLNFTNGFKTFYLCFQNFICCANVSTEIFLKRFKIRLNILSVICLKQQNIILKFPDFLAEPFF